MLLASGNLATTSDNMAIAFYKQGCVICKVFSLRDLEVTYLDANGT